jgi:hypothetical protein
VARPVKPGWFNQKGRPLLGHATETQRATRSKQREYLWERVLCESAIIVTLWKVIGFAGRVFFFVGYTLSQYREGKRDKAASRILTDS